MKLQLRPYQQNIVDQIRQAFRGGYRAPLLQAPTGSGKTVIFSYIAENAHAKGNRVLILVHRRELLYQASEHLQEIGVRHGLIQAGCTMTGEAIQIASVQTLIKRLDRANPPNLIICDEGHHLQRGNSWGRVVENFPDSYLLSVTATPARLDGGGLGVEHNGFNDILINGPSVRSLIDNNFLSPFKVYAPPSNIDFRGIKTQGGDYMKSALASVMDKPKITGNAVEHYKRLCPGAPAIAFCCSVKHAEHVAAEFEANGVPALSVDGKLDIRTRKYRLDCLRDGRIKVLTSCDIVSEGFDLPKVTAGILLRRTQSLGLYLQMVGRCARPFPGKSNAIILDHVNNSLIHDMPDADRVWTLEGAPKKEKRGEVVRSVRQCQNCYCVYSAILPVCPECGSAREIKDRQYEVIEGQLEERKALEAREQRARAFEVAQANSLDDLLEIAKRRGYNRGWAYHKFKARQRKRLKAAFSEGAQTRIDF